MTRPSQCVHGFDGEFCGSLSCKIQSKSIWLSKMFGYTAQMWFCRFTQ